MGNNPLDPIKEDFIRLEALVDGGDDSSEYETDRIARKSRRRPFFRSSSADRNRNVERCAIDLSPNLRMSMRGWGCPKLARMIFASAVGFFIAL